MSEGTNSHLLDASILGREPSDLSIDLAAGTMTVLFEDGGSVSITLAQRNGHPALEVLVHQIPPSLEDEISDDLRDADDPDPESVTAGFLFYQGPGIVDDSVKLAVAEEV